MIIDLYQLVEISLNMIMCQLSFLMAIYGWSMILDGKGSYNSFARSRDGESAIEYYDRIANGTLLDKGWYKYNDFREKQLKNIKKIK